MNHITSSFTPSDLRMYMGRFDNENADGTEYFQVCQTVMSDDMYDKEIRSLNALRDNHPKTILTLDRFGLGSDNEIRVVNVIDWLLRSKN